MKTLFRSSRFAPNHGVVATLLALVGAVAGCSSSRTVSMNSVQPAEITFPREVRTLLIVDRSEFQSRRAGWVEGVLTGELPGSDRAGLQAMVEALRDQLAWSGRFEVRVATETLPGNSLTRALPAPLAWEQVEALAGRYQADAVLGVEIFDSDFVVTKGQRIAKKTVTENNVSREVEVPEYYAEGVANLTIGIRLYEPRRRQIVDQEVFSRSHSWSATGSSVREALLALIDHADATSHVGRAFGADYACKIAPMPSRVSRTFHGKSKRVPEMERGSRLADVADWRGAIEVWQQGLAHAPEKEAGQLCYNIAIAYEVLGEWGNAREWARRAYVDFGHRDAHGYLAELDRRVQREELAAQQME